MTWPFADLVPMRYSAILVDPPWRFALRSPKGESKSPQAHYACMPLAEIQALPVSQLAAPDCLLICWATAPMLPEAIDTVKGWGFRYVSAGAWAKQSSTGEKWAFGPGYVFRSASEFFIAATIGRPKYLSRSIRNLIVAPVREHSRKPDAMHEMIEAMVEGPRAELFGRQRRPGWSCWGNETDLFGNYIDDSLA